jgi:hypothetical protein
MNTKNSVALFFYAALLLTLGAIPKWIEPEIAEQAFWFSFAGALLCAAWGVLGLFGFRRRIGPGLTLAAIAFVLLSQAVIRWMPSGSGKPTSLLLTVLITLMLFVTLGLFAWMMPREDFAPRSAAGSEKIHGPAAKPRKAA